MEGIVLTRSQYREYDQIVTLYTKEKGLMRYVAKGIKKIQSKNSAALEPFSCVKFGDAPGKEFSYITTVQINNYHTAARKDLQTSIYLTFICKTLPQLLSEGESDIHLYYLLIKLLDVADSGAELSLVDWFFIKLMDRLGFLSKRVDESGYIFEDALFTTSRGDVFFTESLQALIWGDYQANTLTPEEQHIFHQVSLCHVRYHSEQAIRDWKLLKIG